MSSSSAMVALVVVQVMGQSYAVLVGLLALLSWPGAVRLVRAEVLSLRSRDYVDMARVAGGVGPQDHVQAHFAERVERGLGDRQFANGRHYSYRGHAELPGRRDPAAYSSLGHLDLRR